MTTTDANASPRLYRRHQRHLARDGSRERYSAQAHAFEAAQDTRLTHVTQNVTLTSVAAAAAAASWTTVSQPSNGDSVTIAGTLYTFLATIAAGTAGNVNVHVGATLAATMTNLFHAVNNSGGSSGVDYDTTGTAANAKVNATNPSADVVTVTAKTAGAAGNSISVSQRCDFGKWSAGDNLAGGTDAYTTVTATGHPFKDGEGPVSFVSGHVPSDQVAATEFWVHVVDTNTIRLGLSLSAVELGDFVHSADVSGSTFELQRTATTAGTFDLLYTNTADAIKSASAANSLT